MEKSEYAANALIDLVFVGMLADSGLYGKAPEGLPDKLREFAPPGLTEPMLRDAAEAVMRTHGSGSFPKVPACLAALEKARNGRGALALPAVAGGTARITKENYFDRARKHGEAMGFRGDGWPVVTRNTPEGWQDWRDWRDYLVSIGIAFIPETMTVPDTKPWFFDKDYKIPDRRNEDQPREADDLMKRAAAAARYRQSVRPKTPESHLREPEAPHVPNREPVTVSASLSRALSHAEEDFI